MGRAKCAVVCHTLSGLWLKCDVLFPLEVAKFKFFMEGKRKGGGKKERYIQGHFLKKFLIYNAQLADELSSMTRVHSKPHFFSRLGVPWLQIKQSSALSLIQG